MAEIETQLTGESKTKGALCYFPFIGWIISVFFILTETEDRYVRFNALQSLLLLLLYVFLNIFLPFLSDVLPQMLYSGLILGLAINLLAPVYMVLSLFLIYRTYNGYRLVLPTLGALAERHSD